MSYRNACPRLFVDIVNRDFIITLIIRVLSFTITPICGVMVSEIQEMWDSQSLGSTDQAGI